MNERLICRRCYHLRQSLSLDDQDLLCRHCCACSWLLVRDSVHEMAGTLMPHNTATATKHLLRLMHRVRAVNR